MKWIFIFMLIPLTPLYAQDERLALIDAVQLVNSTLSQPITAGEKDPCPESIQKEELTCVKDQEEVNSKDYQVMSLVYKNPKQLPEYLRKWIPGETFDASTKGAIRLIIAVPNDNKLLGLWAIMFHKGDGDDFGYTHGSSISVSQTNQKGITTELRASTDLYTEYIRHSPLNKWTSDGVFKAAQHFTNENAIKLVANSVAENKLSYWKAGVGWIQLNSQDTQSFALGTGQQFRWHELLRNTISNDAAMDPVYVKDGFGVRNGFTVEAFFGLQNNFVSGNGSCRLKSYVQTGGQIGSFNSSYFATEAGTYLFIQRPQKKHTTMIGGKGTFTAFDGGENAAFEAGIGHQMGRSSLTLTYNQIYGKPQNYQTYNTTNPNSGKMDAITTIKLGFIIGKFTKK